MSAKTKTSGPRIITGSPHVQQLCARKADHNEARRLSYTIGRDALNLGIGTPLSSSRAIQRTPNTIQKLALIERLRQIADDPSLQCAGTNIIAGIRRYQDGGNLLTQSRQIAMQIKATHP